MEKERGDALEIECVLKKKRRRSRGNGSAGEEEESKSERESESDVGRCHEDKRVRNAITAYFTPFP